MELHLVQQCLVVFYLGVCVLNFQHLVAGSGTATSGFPSLDTVRTAMMPPRVRRFQDRDLWLFPSIVFNCSGNITKWIFQARLNPAGNDGSLPEFQVWREHVATANVPDDYIRVPRDGVADSQTFDDPVFEYVLNPPIEVQEGYIFGVHANENNNIFVEYLDMGDGNASASYYYRSLLSILVLRAGTLDQRFLPLVTAVISLGTGATTSVALPDPTPSPSSEPSPSPTLLTSMADEPPTSPNPGPSATPPSGGGVSTTAVIGIVVALLLVIIIVLAVLVILFVLRCKKQKTIIVEEPQGTVLESKEQFEMTGNDAYTAVITTERNEAYVTNIDVIPAARNEAYGAVATELEGGNSLNREYMNDANYTEPQDQTAQEEYSYAYVR